MPKGTIDTDALALSLVQEAALLIRTIYGKTEISVARSEASCPARLEDGHKRISDIARMEGLAQPTVTLIIKRLEEAGYVERHGDPRDGRVVLVEITPSGMDLLADIRDQYTRFLGGKLAQMSDRDLAALETWTAAVPRLLEIIAQP